MGDQRLRSSEHLRRPSEYRRVFRLGIKQVTPLFVLYVLPTSESCSRLGISVSKRVGKAVVRNRIKRHIRELFRQHKTLLESTYDMVFVARQGAATAPLKEYIWQFLTLWRRCQQIETRKGGDSREN